jgi:uncharacterized protein with ATP-grasp and redox domains
MLIQPDCIPCVLKMTLSVLRKLPLGEERVRDLYGDIIKLPVLTDLRIAKTSPEIIELVMEEITRVTGDPDPFSPQKEEQNGKMLDLYSRLREQLEHSSDPLFTAVKLVIIGNSIDFMMSDEPENLEESIIKRLNSSLPSREYEAFAEQVKRSRLILYLGDNSGEIVLDRLLVEIMRDMYASEIVFVVRSMPALNDATRREAEFVGMDRVATVVENGIDGPVPGTILRRCSAELRELFREADLVISKGGGNFDSLEEDIGGLEQNVTFMLISKCYPYARHFNVPEGQPILANSFRKARRT